MAAFFDNGSMERGMVMQTYRGKSVFGGVAVGKICVYQKGEQTVKRTKIENTEQEKARFNAAVQESIRQLGELYEKAVKEVGEANAAIFEIHQIMLEDEDYLDAVQNIIDTQKVNAEYAVAVTGDNFAQMFAAMEDEYMRGRAADVKDISERIVRVLSGGAGQGIHTDEPVIILADDLAPSETVQLEKDMVLSFVTVHGSVNSHTAILARTMAIPALIGTEELPLDDTVDGKLAVVDGLNGKIYVEPDAQTLEEMKKRRQEELEKKELLQLLKGKENVTLDGKKIMLYANIGNIKDLATVIQNDAGGIGLFRSEFLYLENSDYPTEEQQFLAYKRVLESMAGKKVIIRTLDIGADKQVDYFNLKKEDNPAMGYRAIRICLTRPDIFKTQLRALYRASVYGNLGIMFPMVTSVWEVREAKRMCEEVRRELKNEGIPYSEDVQIGIMIETPAAAINSDRLAKEVDFFSIGTNDLTQYTLACDRQNNDLGRFYDPHHPAVLRLIRLVTENAHKNGIWVGICGELGADLTLTETFLAIGVDELSVTPRSVLPLRNAVRMTDTRESSERILSDLDSDYTAR